jgi:glycosyltransferase involved in cell wall biosynthesis
MYSGVPIIADNSGGPRESVGDGCGFLCRTKEEWASRMWLILSGEKNKLTKGRKQVTSKFGFKKFSADFLEGVREVAHPKKE